MTSKRPGTKKLANEENPDNNETKTENKVEGEHGEHMGTDRGTWDEGKMTAGVSGGQELNRRTNSE